MKVKNDHRSKFSNLSNWKEEALIFFRLLLLLPFVTTYHPAVQDLKKTLKTNWYLRENHPLLKTIFKRPPIISYKRDNSLKEMLERTKM